MRQQYLLAAIFLCVVLLGCERRPAPAVEAEPARIRVSYRPYLSFAPLFIGIDEGYFAEEGLRVELVPTPRFHTGIPLLGAGDLDVLAGSPSASLFNAVARGLRVRVVADKGHYEAKAQPSMGLLVRRALVEEGVLQQPDRLRSLRWMTTLAGEGVEYHVIPGGHFGMIGDDRLEGLARLLRTCIDKARDRS